MRFDHEMQVARSRCFYARCLGAGASADHCCDTVGKRFPALCRGFEVYVYVDSARCQDHAFAGDQFCCRTYYEARCDVHCIRVSAFADADDLSVFDPDVAFNDTDHWVNNDGIRKYCIQYAVFCCCSGDVSHAVTVRLTAAEHYFVSVAGSSVIFFDFCDKACISQMDLVADCWSVHIAVFLSC